jgi:hypothetical protein
MPKTSTYKESYFNRRKDLSYSSAQKILELVRDFYSFSSAVDFGCGTGTWLKACMELGCRTIQGFDGFADISSLCIPSECFSQKLLGEKIDAKKSYDLAICLEAAEHVEEKFSNLIVENLTKASKVILFSAALPGQGGTNHINEQPPEFWQKKFMKFNYTQLDIIRPIIWDEPAVAWWYKQNIFLYVHDESIEALKLPDHPNLFAQKHIVHPECLISKIAEIDIDNASVANLSKALLKRIKKKLVI